MSKIEKIERIRVIIREHLDDDPFEKAIADVHDAKPKGSTVGVKMTTRDNVYGTYMCFKQPTLSAIEVAEALNELFEILLKEKSED